MTRKRLYLFAALLTLAVAGIVTGVVVNAVKKSNADVGDPNAAPTDLSIRPDSALSRSFYGLAYTPLSAQYPWCGSTLREVVEDIKILSQMTTRLRLYGMDCQQADFTLQAIRLLKVPMKVMVTLWVDSNATTYQRQVDTLWSVLDTHGTDMIEGISVGNEALFREEVTLTDLSSRMTTIRTQLQTRGYKSVPVFTSEMGSLYTTGLIKASDLALANIHPYFAGGTVQAAPQWTDTYFTENILNPSKAQGKPAIIGEVGWPTAGASQNASVASVNNLQYFVDNYVCQANAQGVAYYFFEAFDEPWKEKTFTLLEASWGLLEAKSRKPKVKLPKCPLS
ncbi:MAG: glycoside hydrolase [Piptocephalis tieghemiana]|nr:MAG: glycoside hydrolase [Piptocephalis tieghemiana]